MPQNNSHLHRGPSFTYRDRGGKSRKRPADIDEIIHFVRTQGVMRESTEMRLTRKAPLPGIGQHSMLTAATIPPYHHQRTASNHNSNHNSSSVDTEGTDEAYEFDEDLVDDPPDTHRTLSPPATTPKRGIHNTLFSCSQSNMLSKSLEPHQFVTLSPIKPAGKQVRGRFDPSPTHRSVPRTLLPPMLTHERPICQPARPNAPSPSVTTPLSEGEEEEEDFIEK